MAAEQPGEKVALKDATVADLDTLLKQSRGTRSRLLPIWLVSLAYYNNLQWVFYNRGKIERPQLSPNRITLTDNRITGIVRGEVAKMIKQNPTFQVTPSSAEDADLQASEMGEKVLSFLWRDLGLRNQLEDTLRWTKILGAGFWKVTWDSAKGQKVQIAADVQGKPILHPETGAPLKPENLLDEENNMPEGVKAKTIATGDVHVETVGPMEIFPDPIAKQFEQAEWVIQSSVKSAEYVKLHFDAEVQPDVDVAGGPIEARMYLGVGSMEGASGYKGVQVNEYWCKPNSQHPQGRHCVWVKNKMLLEENNPYDDLPYVMFRGIPVPGQFWPTSTVELLKGPQTYLNKTISQIAENLSKFGNPSLMVSRQAGVQYSGKPGEVIHYNSTIPDPQPQYLQAPPLPQYVLDQQKQIELSIQEISGQHEVSHAQVPAGVKAASAINLLQEADDTRLGPSIYEMEEAIGRAGEMLLKLVAKYWSDERTIMITGENHALDAMSFKGAALRENTQVEVQSGSMFPRSKAAKQASIQDMLNLVFQYQGEKPNKRTLAKVLKDLEAGDLAKLFGDTSVSEGQINRENQELALGGELPVNVYDEHEAHIEGHQEWQRGPTYKQLGPDVAQSTERHVALHRQQLIAQKQPPPPEKHDPVETLAYQYAPPDIQRQIEAQAGMQPSTEKPVEQQPAGKPTGGEEE